MRRTLFAIAGLLTACSVAPADDAGVETGPCLDGACFGGLVCLSDRCVDPDGEDTEADDDDGIGPVDDGDEAGPAGDASASGASGDDGVDAGPVSDASASGVSGDDGVSGGSGDESGSADSAGDDGVSGNDDGPSGPGLGDPCDVWDQDCAAGLKCNPWADDGGNAWNAAHCVDLDASPAGIGDPCTVQGAATSGADDCDLGLMCWGVDLDTNDGTCTELCSGSAAAPECATPETTCSISNDGSLPLCLPGCDPIEQDCPGGDGCYPNGEVFVCAPDASGAQGQYGDACNFINVCDPGLLCATPETVPDCASVGCCTPFCAVGEDTCPAGTVCAAFVGDVGVCSL